MFKSNSKLYSNEVEALIKQTNEQYEGGFYKESLMSCTQALELHPNDVNILTNRGRILDKLESYQEALAHHNLSLKLQPDNLLALYNRGNTYKNIGNYIAALKDYDCYLFLKPDDADVLAGRGWVLDQLKRYKEAIESYSRSLALRPLLVIHAPTFKYRANSFKTLGLYKEALKDYDIYLKVETRNAEAYANRGWVLNELKDYEKALTDYNYSLKLRPNHLPTLCNRTEVLKNLGRFAEAMNDCKLCLVIDPHYAAALANRSKILRLLASKGNKKEKEDYFFSKVYVKITSALNYIIVKLIRYARFYLITPVRKTQNLPFSLENTPVAKGDQVASPSSNFFEETKDYKPESPPEMTSTPALKTEKLLKRKVAAKKNKKREKMAAELPTQGNTTRFDVNPDSEKVRSVPCESTTHVSPIEQLISKNELSTSNPILKAIKESEPTVSWQNRFFLSTREFFELLYMIITIKIIAMFKLPHSNRAISFAQNPQSKIKKSIELAHSDEDDSNHPEAQNRLDKPINNPNLGLEIALQAAKEKMSSMEIRLEEQGKTMLFMKQKFDELQEKSIKKAESTEEVEHLQTELQTLRSQLQQDSDLKRHCEEQAQRIQFLESETKNTQVPPVDSSQSSMIEAQLNLLKSQLKQMQCLYGQIQSQILPVNVSKNALLRQNPAAVPARIEGSSPLPLANASEIYVVELPASISKILFSFIQASYYVLIVGGAVRDFLLKKVPVDVDIITNMPASMLLSHFHEYSIHAAPYVLGLYQISIAGLKIDISYCDTAVFISNAAFMQNALTRAFTVNALYCDFQGRIYDPLKTGLLDLLNHRVLRLISIEHSWFEYDPFLLLRGARLAVQYELAIPLESRQLMQHFSALLENSDHQRLYSEFKRLFLRGYALKNFRKLMELDLLKPIFPKTVEFLQSYQGEYYQAWLQLELGKTDQLAIEHAPLSINYIYAIFLAGSVLATLEQPPVFSSKINPSVDKVLTETFLDQSNTMSLEKIKKMIVACIRKILSPDSLEFHQAPKTTMLKRVLK